MKTNTMTLLPLGFWAVEAFGETTSFLVNFNGEQLLIDASPGVCRQLHAASVNASDICALLVSHVHGDHISGLPYFVFARNVAARTAKKLVTPLTIAGNRETVTAADVLVRTCYPDRPDLTPNVKILAQCETVKLGPFDVQSFAVQHTVPTYAFRIACGGKSIGYTSDTIFFSELANFVRGVDLLIVEAFGTRKDFYEVAKKQSHLLADEAGLLAEQAGVKRALLFHMHLPYQSTEKRNELISEVRKNFSGDIIFPTALEEIVI